MGESGFQVVATGWLLAKLDAAQYHMLLAMCSDQVVPSAPSEQILNRISESCRAQNDADLEFFVHWSRHLVAYLRQITGSELLIGASAVTYNPHFPYFSSPYSPDVHFGAVAEWPQKPALLIIDSFAPPMRRQTSSVAGKSDRPWFSSMGSEAASKSRRPRPSHTQHESVLIC